jgi:hypothetical protein
MGTWSRPLFATVSPGLPSDYVIDLTKLSEATIAAWQHAAFLHNTTKQRVTLSEFMNTGCDTHKIMDHMDSSQIYRWLDLFKHILEVNPTLQEAQFHFYCVDTNEPYYFSLVRDREDVPTTLFMFVGQSESIYYFKKRVYYFKKRDYDEEPRLIFREDEYTRVWKTCDFRVLCLRANSIGWF